VRFKAVLGNT